MATIRIIQANVNRNVVSQDLARAMMERKRCDCLCAQEPNRRSLTVKTTNMYPASAPDLNAVIYKSKQSVIPVFTTGKENSYIFLQCSCLCLYSVYISPNCSFESFERQIEELFVHVGRTIATTGLPVVICENFNAKNRLWGGSVTARRPSTKRGIRDGCCGLKRWCVPNTGSIKRTLIR